MTRVIYLENNCLHLFIFALSRGFSEMLPPCGSCAERCPCNWGTPFLNCWEGLWLTPALTFLKFSDSLLLNIAFFPTPRRLFSRTFFGELPLWKSPSQRLFPEEPELRRCLFVPIRDPGAEGQTFRTGGWGFWTGPSSPGALTMPPSHGQFEGSLAFPIGRYWQENDREWA